MANKSDGGLTRMDDRRPAIKINLPIRFHCNNIEAKQCLFNGKAERARLLNKCDERSPQPIVSRPAYSKSYPFLSRLFSSITCNTTAQ